MVMTGDGLWQCFTHSTVHGGKLNQLRPGAAQVNTSNWNPECQGIAMAVSQNSHVLCKDSSLIPQTWHV